MPRKRKNQSHNTGVNTIYLLTNKINGKLYIGQTWRKLHYRAGKKGEGYRNCNYLYQAIQKHGWENFEYSVIFQTQKQEVADYVETIMIDLYGSRDHSKGYNLKTGGNSKGKHSEATKKKISESIKKVEWSEEAKINKRKFIGWMKGKKQPPKSKETIENHTAMMREWHATHEHPMKGKHHSEDAKKKISEKLTGRKMDPEMSRKRGLKHRISPELEAAVLADYEAKVLGLHEIAEKNDVGYNTVLRVARRNGKFEPRPHISRITKGEFGPEKANEINSKISEAGKRRKSS